MKESLQTRLPALALLFAVAACGTGGGPIQAGPRSADEARRYCEDRMYVEHSAHPRGPPDWNLYDRCVRETNGRR